MTAVPPTSTWDQGCLDELGTLLSTGADFDLACRWLKNQDPSVHMDLVRIAVAGMLGAYWQAVQTELVDVARARGQATWAQVAAMSSRTSAAAAQRHFTRDAGTYQGYNPRQRRAKTCLGPRPREL